jgi:hypothetical protein
MNVKTAGCIAIAALTLKVQAHHSFSMFDVDKTVTVSGTLKEFEFINPHCWLHLTVVDAVSGKSMVWAFEMGSVGQIAAQGWKADTVKTGDKVTVDFHPMKDGSHGGQYLGAKLADGRSFNQNQTGNPNTNNAGR